MLDLEKDRYIILELIPNRSHPEQGNIVQISALKLQGLQLLDRFDYRVEDKFVGNSDLLRMISYDKRSFTYVNNPYFILEKFKQWICDYPLLLLENSYTLDYLREIPNPKEMIYPYLGMEYSLDIFDRIQRKYSLEPSPHLVDLLYEAVIYESNSKKSSE